MLDKVPLSAFAIWQLHGIYIIFNNAALMNQFSANSLNLILKAFPLLYAEILFLASMP